MRGAGIARMRSDEQRIAEYEPAALSGDGDAGIVHDRRISSRAGIHEKYAATEDRDADIIANRRIGGGGRVLERDGSWQKIVQHRDGRAASIARILKSQRRLKKVEPRVTCRAGVLEDHARVKRRDCRRA